MDPDKIKHNRTFALYYLAIVLITFLAYIPSLFHMPRSDQFTYLINTAGQQNTLSQAFKNYAYNRMDLSYGQSDIILFRPSLCIFLGLERWLFGLNFMYWQAAGIFLHLLVLWALLKYLYDTRPSPWAFLWTLYFGVLFAGSEMVIWSHINGYMIFVLCVLYAVGKTQRIVAEKQITRQDLLAVTAALTLAVFTYELGILVCFLLALYFSLSFVPGPEEKIAVRKHAAVAGLCLPALLFVSFDILDLFYRHLSLSARQDPALSLQNISHLAQNTASAFLWWLHSGLFPSRIFTETGQRTFLYPLYIDFLGKPALSSLIIVQTSASIALIITLLTAFVTRVDRPFFARRWKALGLWLGLIMAYTLLIALGRISVRGQERILVENPYYHYLFWAFLIPFLYNLLPFGQDGKRLGAAAEKISLALLVLLIAFNVHFTFRLASLRARDDKPQWALNRSIQALAKRSTPANPFTFSINPSVDSGPYELTWARRLNDPAGKTYHYLKLLYPQYYQETAPRYVLINKNGAPALIPSGN